MPADRPEQHAQNGTGQRPFLEPAEQPAAHAKDRKRNEDRNPVHVAKAAALKKDLVQQEASAEVSRKLLG